MKQAKEKFCWNIIWQTLLIATALAAIYGPILHGDWLWDDAFDITQNKITQSPIGLWPIWFQPGSQVDYYPIKASVQWLQWHLWGNDTFGYHFTNVLLHFVSALLLWKLLAKFNLRYAWLGGLLFAIHPALVESVAWIAELKNTLSLPLFLLSVICWLDFDEHRRRSDYLASLGLFLVALLAKPGMIMFPVVLLLYIWWKRNRITAQDLKATAPFFLLSLLIGLITLSIAGWYRDYHHVLPNPPHQGTALSRLALIGLAYAFYFSKAILPLGLIPLYPQWPVNPPTLLQFTPWPILLAVLCFLWKKQTDWSRAALLGLGFFLLMLLPFVSLDVGGFTDFTWVMDHFLYIPIIGLIGLAIAALEKAASLMSPSARLLGTLVLIFILLTLTQMSRAYARQFQNAETLWTYTIAHNPAAWVALNNLGLIKAAQGRYSEATALYEQTLRLRPNQSDVYNNLGNLAAHQNRFSEALAYYDRALAIQPNFPVAIYDRGQTLSRQGHLIEALAAYREALRLKPDYPDALNAAGATLFRMSRPTEARQSFEQALIIDPTYTPAHLNLANLLAGSGDWTQARAHFTEVLHLDPANAEALAALARLDQEHR